MTQTTNPKHRRQFSLKEILGITAGLSVTLAMIVRGNEPLIVCGWVLLPTILSACLGYMVNGRDGARNGLWIGFCISWAVVAIYVWSSL